MDTITLTFQGYYKEDNPLIEKEHSGSGIYAVYAGKPKPEKRCEINRLLYVGETGEIYKRLSNHERKEDWIKELSNDEILYFLIANTDCTDKERLRVQAAIINDCKPPCNSDYVDNFDFDDIQIQVNSKDKRHRTIKSDFIVKRNVS